MTYNLDQKSLEKLLNNNPGLSIDARFSTVEAPATNTPPSSAVNKQRGRDNKAAGEAFQQELDIYHAQLYRDGQALVYRTDPPVRYAGDGKWIVTGKGPVDYIAITRMGVVGFDAKVRTGDAFSIGMDSLHQLHWLRDLVDLDNIGGYVVRWSDYDEARWHDVSTIDGKLVRMVDGVPLDGVEWLGAIKRHGIPPD